ncbi:DUF2510 domain-containing protein [Streptomyces sp. F-3]|uniref:DUF2510 domain-containing protein n=1 Tax=Streptomyces sp. F-3 TaxID=1840095 RepID=UPI0008321A1F|nr:DUF2510 domain-containing protein [Streptomyces sp. F-3]
MTQATPPGWYPDPGQTSDGPATERWWDGRAWTERIRPAGAAAAWGPPAQPPAAGPPPERPEHPPEHPGRPGHTGYTRYTEQPGHPGQPAFPGLPPAPPQQGARRGLRIGVAAVAVTALLASIGVGVYALSTDGGSDSRVAGSRQEPDGRDDGPDGPGDPGESDGSDGDRREAPKITSGSVTDVLNGITLPVPDGWYGRRLTMGAQITSSDSYACPGDTGQSCTKGGAYSAPAVALGTRGRTAEEVAKADIAANAEESYGGTAYGGITSHEVLASKEVTVAGQKGYLVRWKAITRTGSDGYVESLAFPSPVDARQMVVVRFGVDVGEKQSVIDEITRGIRAAGSGNDLTV